MTVSDKKKKLIIKILWVIAAIVSVKTIFTDFGADNAYSMVMSYRHISGDAMFVNMWEPHQTSVFFTDIFMWIYGLLVPSFAGAALFLQVCGTLLYAGIACLLFKKIKALSGNTAAHLATIFFLIFRVKQSVFPEYANLLIAFSVLMFLTLMNFLKNQKKYGTLVFSALFLCLAVLSYPSCAISLIAAVVVLCMYSERKLKNSLVFVGTAAGAGALYVSFFALRIGPAKFIACIKGILASDIHGNEDFVSRLDYFRGFLIALVWVAATVLLTIAVKLIAKRFFKKELNKFGLFGAIFFLSNAAMLLIQRKTGLDWTCCFYIIPLILIVVALLDIKKAGDECKMFFVSALFVSASSCIAAAMLSNLGIITFVPFLVLGGAVSFAVIDDFDRKAFAGAALIVATVLFNRGFVVWGYANKGNVHTVIEIERYIKGGPTFGIMTDYMTSKEMETNMAEFPAFVHEDDRLMIVGDNWLFDPAVFMATNAEIANPSVIDTPYYNGGIEDYYSINPDKMPTVVAVKCWYGEMYFSDDTYIMQWINQNYECAGDGSYYRFFRLSNRAQ